MANLTTLAAVKQYLGITTTGQDLLIPALIARESAYVETYCGRKFSVVTNTNKLLNGTGTDRLVLPGEPILSVSALSILGTVISASPDGIQSGYVIDDICLYLVGGFSFGTRFPRGHQNVTCSWLSGYQETETDFVPTGNTITPITGGTATSVVSVFDNTANVALTVTGNAPASGQYSFASGVFTFNAAQYNHSMTMNYYYVPSPVEQAVIEMVGLDLQQRSNIGINSKSLAGETVTYGNRSMTPSTQEMLQTYRKRMVT